MPRLKWDEIGERLYETGVEQGTLYVYDANATTPGYQPGVAWNGLTQVTESPSGAESNPIYADNIKYLDLRSAEEFGATVEAYTYPDEWYDCDGSKEIAPGVVVGQQNRAMFGMAYKTLVGNDTQNNDYGYKLHVIYGATASPSERGYQTVNDSPEAITFSWEITTTPVDAGEGYKKTAILTIDSTKFKTDEDKAKLKKIEDALFGVDADTEKGIEDAVATLLMPAEIIALLEGN